MHIRISTIYHSWIEKIGAISGIPDSMLHIHAGLLILLLARLVTRRSLASFIPFAFVCLAEGLNEIMDRLYFGSWRPADTISDVINTLFWPAMLCIVIRIQPLVPPLRAAGSSHAHGV